MALVQGVKILYVQRFLISRFGAAAWRLLTDALYAGGNVPLALLETLTGADGEPLGAVEPASWYDFTISNEINRLLWVQYDDESYSFMRELGGFEADIALSMVNSWFVPLNNPLRAIENMDPYWRRSNDSGYWRSKFEAGSIVSELIDWPVAQHESCQRILGFLGRTLERFGIHHGPLEHPACRARSHPTCIFRTSVIEFPESREQASYRVTVHDVANISRELMQFHDREALADSIIVLFHNHLGYDYVALWVRAGVADAMHCIRTVGTEGTNTSRYIMEAGGYVCGRLELGTRRIVMGPGDHDIMSLLVPTVACAIRNLWCNTHSESIAPIPVESNSNGEHARQERARARWELTARQTEVLSLVVCGRTNREIADLIGCRERTVEQHVRTLLAKCGADNRVMLAALYWAGN